MANPSLQIGNSNWAIKEDNLLGYSTAGTRFVPQPITMTRASAGTRVNSSGLVETVELLGSELVTNGDFENNVIGWNKFKSNATESWNAGGYLDFTKTGVSGRLGSDVLIETNKTYKISVNVISLGGILDLYVGLSDFESPYAGVSSTPLVVGTNTFYLTYPGSASSKGVYLQSAGSNYFGLTASIDSISVKESTKNNLARVDYDGTASSLLVEPERTNLITSSEDFSGWSKNQIVVTTISETSPLGDTVSKVVGANNSTLKLLYKNNFINSSKVFSVLVKKSGYDFASIRIGSGGGTVIFDLVNGVVGDMTSGLVSTDYKIEDYGSGWFRLSARFPAFTGDTYMSITGVASNSIYSTTGNGVDGILLAYAQIEEGSYPTSYIPTSGSTVTRNQETYTKTGISDLINSEEGVLFLEMAALADDGTNRYISINDGSTQNYVYFRFMSTSNRVLTRTVVAGVTINTLQITISDTTAFNKYAIKWKSGDYAFWINGVEVGTDSSSTIFSADVLNQIDFDFPTASGNFPSKVKQLQVYDTSLSDEQSAALTS